MLIRHHPLTHPTQSQTGTTLSPAKVTEAVTITETNFILFSVDKQAVNMISLFRFFQSLSLFLSLPLYVFEQHTIQATQQTPFHTHIHTQVAASSRFSESVTAVSINPWNKSVHCFLFSLSLLYVDSHLTKTKPECPRSHALLYTRGGTCARAHALHTRRTRALASLLIIGSLTRTCTRTHSAQLVSTGKKTYKFWRLVEGSLQSVSASKKDSHVSLVASTHTPSHTRIKNTDHRYVYFHIPPVTPTHPFRIIHF